jgi:hypothetical protein
MRHRVGEVWRSRVSRYRGSGEDGPMAELPAAGCAPLEIGLGLGQWGVAAAGEPRTVSRGPPPPFIAQCDGGPPTANGLSAPDQGASQGPSGRWAILVGDQSNILPLDLTLYFKL